MVTQPNPQAIYWGLVLDGQGWRVTGTQGARDTQHCPWKKEFSILVLWYGHHWIWSWKTMDNCLWTLTLCQTPVNYLTMFYSTAGVKMLSSLINLTARLESHRWQGGKNQPAWCDSHHSMDLSSSAKQKTWQCRTSQETGFWLQLCDYEKTRPAMKGFNKTTGPDRWAEINYKSRRWKTFQILGIIRTKINLGMVTACSQTNNNG